MRRTGIISCRWRCSARATAVSWTPSPSDVVVIGDTPHDIACARAVGAMPVAVATGGYSVDQLSGAGADMVFKDLSETEAVVRVLER